MARVKYASIVSEVSGSIGSATFQKSLYGNSLRSKPNPRRSSTALQQYCRNLMMQLHQAWAALSDDQRRQWNQFIAYSSAKIRRDKNILTTGHALFIKYNYFRLLSQLSILTDFDYVIIESFPLPDGIATDGFDIDIYYDANFNGNTIWGVVKLSAPMKPSLSFTAAGLRYQFATWAAGGRSTFSYNTSYIAAFGAIAPVGSTVHYSSTFFSMLAPIISQELCGSFIVGAA